MSQKIGSSRGEISISDNILETGITVDSDSKVYFYTRSVDKNTKVDTIDGSSKESSLYLKFADGSQVLCKMQDSVKFELVDDTCNSQEIIEINNENNIIDGVKKETIVFVDDSNARNERVCITENGKRSYVCELEGCKRRFTSRNYLKTHQRNHTGERPFKCDECNTAFNTDYALKVHRRRHTGDKPYQ